MTQKAEVRTHSGLIKEPAHLKYIFALTHFPALIQMILHVLESIGNPPDWDDVRKLPLLRLLPPMDAGSNHGAGHQAEEEEDKQRFWEVGHVLISPLFEYYCLPKVPLSRVLFYYLHLPKARAPWYPFCLLLWSFNRSSWYLTNVFAQCIIFCLNSSPVLWWRLIKDKKTIVGV